MKITKKLIAEFGGMDAIRVRVEARKRVLKEWDGEKPLPVEHDMIDYLARTGDVMEEMPEPVILPAVEELDPNMKVHVEAQVQNLRATVEALQADMATIKTAVALLLEREAARGNPNK